MADMPADNSSLADRGDRVAKDQFFDAEDAGTKASVVSGGMPFTRGICVRNRISTARRRTRTRSTMARRRLVLAHAGAQAMVFGRVAGGRRQPRGPNAAPGAYCRACHGFGGRAPRLPTAP